MSIRFLLWLILFFNAAHVSAANFTVTRSDDRNATCLSGTDCSLREAVNAANNAPSDDTIFFASGVTTVTLNNVEIAIANAGKLTINGRGADVFTIDGGPGQNRIFYVAGATVTIRNMKLTGGNAEGTNPMFNLQGGAIYTNGGSITLDRVHVTGNTATSGGAAGGIYFFAGFGSPVHRILNSTFSNNQTGTSCGAFYISGGNSITVVNSTFTGNSAQTGGAICNDGNLTLRNATISGNTGVQGGGAMYQGSVANFANTIIAGNASSSGFPEIWSNGTTTSHGNNHVGDSPGDSANTGTPINYQTSDIRDIPPLLEPLQANGGQTPTLALMNGSPAINAGSNSLAGDPSNANAPLVADQRGFTRITGPNVDIGAFEFNSIPVALTVSGRATARNRAAPRVILTLTGGAGSSLTALTNPFGYFRFRNVRIGEIYTVSARSKQAIFASQMIYVGGDIFDLNFSEQ